MIVTLHFLDDLSINQIKIKGSTKSVFSSPGLVNLLSG